jgi:hypothetical protein
MIKQPPGRTMFVDRKRWGGKCAVTGEITQVKIIRPDDDDDDDVI